MKRTPFSSKSLWAGQACLALASLTTHAADVTITPPVGGGFVVKDQAGNQNFTRAGDFVVDKEGYLVTPSGSRVQGFGAVDGSIPVDAQLTDMRVQIGQMMPPVETTENCTPKRSSKTTS